MFLLLISLFVLPTVIFADCVISIKNDLDICQPLIMDLSDKIKYPQKGHNMHFSTNERFMLACPGSRLQLVVGKDIVNLSELEEATCINNKELFVKYTKTHFSKIKCAQCPEETVSFTGNTCEGENQEVDIGFSVRDKPISLIRICFDNKSHTTLYSYLQQMPSIIGKQTKSLENAEKFWRKDKFRTLGGKISNNKAMDLFNLKTQIAAISKLLGCKSTTANRYINSTFCLSRGHLVARADFIYEYQQRATYHMVNAAPQWKLFNAGNWADVEDKVRNLVIDSKLTLETYTGTYGVMTLPHDQTGKEIEMYLYTDNGNREYPTPLLFWKYIYEPESRAGIVLVGVNNPYIKDISKAIICEDIYDRIEWIKPMDVSDKMLLQRKNTTKGYTYACSPGDFRKTVTYAPNLTVERDLTSIRYTEKPQPKVQQETTSTEAIAKKLPKTKPTTKKQMKNRQKNYMRQNLQKKKTTGNNN